MGIKHVLSAPRSPWQRAYVERLVGTLRRECLDHRIVFHERSLHRYLGTFVDYYHRNRVYLALEKDTPEPDRSSRRSLAGSSRYRCWAGCITDMSGAPPEESNNVRILRASAARSAQPLFVVTNHEPNLGLESLLQPSSTAQRDTVRSSRPRASRSRLTRSFISVLMRFPKRTVH